MLQANAADSPATRTANVDPIFSCGNQKLTVAQVLAGRYPSPDILNVPEACKNRARELIEKWRKEDLATWELLGAQACSGQASPVEWVLEQNIVRTERETEMLDAGCDCYGEILAQATNGPAAPGNLAIAAQTGLLTQRLDEKSAQLPVRYSPEVAARRANAGISRNAEEIVKALAGKRESADSAKLLDVEVSGAWSNQYKTALKATLLEAHRIETLSMELGHTDPNSPLVSRDLPGSRQRLQEQARLLGVAYDGLVRDRELPRGQCYAALAIRHQVMLDFIKQLLTPPPGTR